MVSGRQTTKSFKNPTIIKVPEEDWIVVEDTHEALVSEDQFVRVQQLAKTKVRTNKRYGSNMFAGLLKCADCGRNLTYSSTKEMRGGEGGFDCSGHTHSYRLKDIERCTAHNTPYKPLRESVLWQLNQVLAAVFDIEDYLARTQHKRNDTSEIERRTITRLKQRDGQLRVFTRRVFEQNSDGTISDETFAEIYNGYQAEQKDIASKIEALEARLSCQRSEHENIERFLLLARERREIIELTREVLLDFIEKIVVHNATGDRGYRKQDIEIHYRFIGRLDGETVAL